MYNPKYLDTSTPVTYTHGILVTTAEQFDFICEHHPKVTLIAIAEEALQEYYNEVVIYNTVYGDINYLDDTHVTFDSIYKPNKIKLKELV